MKAVLLWLLVVNCALGGIDGPLDPQRFGMLNHDQALSTQLAEDSLLKWLVRSSDPNDPHQSITLSFLGQEVSEAIHDGSAAQNIAADLKAGDDALYKAMARVLYSYNFSDKDALSLLDNWARLGPDKTLDSVLANVTEGGRSLQALTDYLMEQDENWVKAVYTVRDITAGSSSVSAEILRQSLVSAAAMPPATAVALGTGRLRGGQRPGQSGALQPFAAHLPNQYSAGSLYPPSAARRRLLLRKRLAARPNQDCPGSAFGQ